MNSFNSFLEKVLTLAVNPVIKVIFVVAILVFLWGVIEFIAGAGSSEKRQIGKQHIVWGLIGLFIMLSVFGIFNLIKSFVSDLSGGGNYNYATIAECDYYKGVPVDCGKCGGGCSGGLICCQIP